MSSRDRQRLLRRTINAHFLTPMCIQPYARVTASQTQDMQKILQPFTYRFHGPAPGTCTDLGNLLNKCEFSSGSKIMGFRWETFTYAKKWKNLISWGGKWFP